MSISDKFRELRGNYLLHFTESKNGCSIYLDRVIYSRAELEKKGILYPLEANSYKCCNKGIYLHGKVFLAFSIYHKFIQKQIYSPDIKVDFIAIDISVLDIPGVLISDKISLCKDVHFYTPEEALEKLEMENTATWLKKGQYYGEARNYEALIPQKIDLRQYIFNEGKGSLIERAEAEFLAGIKLFF